MNYQETLDYLYSRLPMFQRIGAAAYKADLNNAIQICKALNNPENNFKSIHVAGTNGKGSTSHMLASTLQEQGYKTGLYTSPHLKDFRERIKINGEMISQSYIIDFVKKNKAYFESIEPSFFEWTVGLAFKYFEEQQVDVAVIETGLGGRLDSTNVIAPLVSVITNISYDHEALLGDTIEKIATEKAGIIKAGIPCVIGETNGLSKPVFIAKSKEQKAPIYFASEEYELKNVRLQEKEKLYLTGNLYKHDKLHVKDLQCELLGLYQKKNIPTVIKTIELLQKQLPISEESVKKGIKKVIRNTGLLGRWQILSDSPLTICDTGHNEDGIKEVLYQISQTSHEQLRFVLGMVNDKDVTKILGLLSKSAIYYFTQASIPRALPAEELYSKAKVYGLKGNVFPTVKAAILQAKVESKPNDLIFIGGSTFTVADAL